MLPDSASHRRPRISLLAAWIVFCAACNCLGWLLSAMQQLNAAGYAIAMVAGLSVFAIWKIKTGAILFLPSNARKLRRRFRQPFPLAFLTLATLAILGGLLYPPSNADALTQRIPRLLHWLAEERWHWIQNVSASFNTRSVGFEWLMAPFLALTKTDRWVFLLNAVAYLFLPGLLFSVLTRLGVRRRVAGHWMWIAPTGYCFLTQAGSIANDAIAGMFALAALSYALRASAGGRISDLWLSCLAAALMTSIKTTNLALLLPWVFAVFPGIRLARLRPILSSGIALAALAASFFPVAAINHHFTRDWTGASYELSKDLREINPAVALTGNALNLTIQNLVPPVFPLAERWNENAHRALPKGLAAAMKKSFEPGGAHLRVMELQFEVNAGLGMGVTLLLIISWLAALSRRKKSRAMVSDSMRLKLARWSPFVSLLVFMAKVGLSASARIIAPFYLLLIPWFLTHSGHEQIVRRRWWRISAGLVFVLAFVVLALNPGRPLWPAKTILTKLSEQRPESRVIARGKMLYESYAVRWDALASVRNYLPADERSIGFISFVSSTTLETSLWRPFGQRRIIGLSPQMTPEEIQQKGVRYVVIGTDSTDKRVPDITFSDWLRNWLLAQNGRILGQAEARNVATKESAQWFAIELSFSSPVEN